MTSESHIYETDRILGFLDAHRKTGKKIGLCHGCFDLVHYGHIEHFQAAKDQCDVLVVSITADAFIKKGPGRPVFNQQMRAHFLCQMKMVDAVYIANEPTAVGVLSLIKPDFYFKGIDYLDETQDVTGMITQEKGLVEKLGGRLVVTKTQKHSSSQLVNEHRLINVPDRVKEYLYDLREQVSFSEICEYIDGRFAELKLTVMGDLIIDEYLRCLPVGTTSKSPTISAIFQDRELMTGGSGAIARHVAEYAREVSFFFHKGQKNWNFDSLLAETLPTNVELSFDASEDTFTPHKIRFMSDGYPNTINLGGSDPDDVRNPTKLFEYAFLTTQGAHPSPFLRITESERKRLCSNDGVIWADFGHGALGRDAWSFVRSSSKFTAVNVQTNSTNYGFNLADKYPGASLLCIDELETRLLMKDRVTPINTLAAALVSQLECGELVITQGRKGISFYSGKEPVHVPAIASKVIDPVGAGDAVLAMVTLCRVAKAPTHVTSILASAAGAIACMTVGNRTPVQKSLLKKYLGGIFS